MEQVAADRAEQSVGFTSFSDSQQYRQKLGGAAQIWEWSPRQLDFLKSNLPETTSAKLHYVPLWSSVATDDSHTFCAEILASPSCQGVPDVDVLFFGALTESRKKLCDSVVAMVNQLDCRERQSNVSVCLALWHCSGVQYLYQSTATHRRGRCQCNVC